MRLMSQRGTVVDFDEHVGLGVIDSDEPSAASVSVDADPKAVERRTVPEVSQRYRFHCTQIADGSRRIEPGTKVTFVLVARHGGVWEAAELRRL